MRYHILIIVTLAFSVSFHLCDSVVPHKKMNSLPGNNGIVTLARRLDFLPLFQHNCEHVSFPMKRLVRRRIHSIRIKAPTSSSTEAPTSTTIHSSQRIFPLNRPPDPSSLKSNHTDDQNSYIYNQSKILREWMRNKKSIVCITGAGMSTESGIPDYRGNKGSYFEGHKPIIHHEFMSSELTRKRYWARSLLGYSPFSNARPNLGHFALADLEKGGWIGVKLEESTELKFQSNSHVLANGTSSWESHLILSGGERKKLSIITQNVDILHSKGGLKNVLHLHGRGDVVRCMSCGVTHDRQYYHDKLWEWNRELIDKSTSTINEKVNRNKENGKTVLRPDGDAEWTGESYDNLMLPPCPHCGVNDTHSDSHNHTNNHKGVNATVNDKTNNSQQAFFKTDVVFFGDSIPRYRVHLSNAAIDAADGLLCIGTSLAVHSAFRLAKRAIGREIPVAILNVGETRVEREGLGISGGGEREIPLVTKIESPIGETLAELVNMLHNEER